MRTPARALAGAMAILLVAGAAACGDDGDDDGGEGADEVEAAEVAGDDRETTTSVPPTPEELAVAAYRESWAATFRALDPPDPESPDIAETLTGEALSETVNIVATRERLGHRVEGAIEPHPVVVSATATEVLLDDCAIENSVEYDGAGAVVDTADDATFNYRVTVVNEDGAWKVAKFERREEPCEPA